LLDETTTMVLATRGPNGTPRATPVYFAAEHTLRLIFLSDPDSAHSRNLVGAPQASVAIYPEESDWRRLRGIQMTGHAAAIEGSEAELARRAYARRFPFVSELARVLDASRTYAFRPSWVRLIDNRRGFGFQHEWMLA
jgi:hypothetical protein